MLLYHKNNPGYYCDNDLKLSDLFPIRVFVHSVTCGGHGLLQQDDHYAVLAVKSGSLRINSTSVSCTLSDGQIIILEPYSNCHIYPTCDTDYCYLQFSGEHAADFAAYTNLIYAYDGVYEELAACLNRPDKHNVHFVPILFRLYSFLGAQKSRYAEEQTKNRYVKMALDNINYSGNDPDYSFEVLARAMNITPKYLSRLFKNEVGISMQEYLKTRRLSIGYELLLQGYKVKDAAERCGIRHVNNFSQMFFRRYGMRPSEVKPNGDK